MSNTTVRFCDHEEFHGAALRMAAAGAVAGLVAFLAFGGAATTWGLALVAAAAVFGAIPWALRTNARQLAVRALLVVMAGGALVLITHLGEPTSAVVVFGLLIGAGFACGLRDRKLLVAIAAGALVAVLAREVLTSISSAQQLASLPAWLSATLAGAAFSFVSVVALLPRHLDLVKNPVADAYDGLRNTTNGEVRELVDRAFALWTKSSEELAEGDQHRESLEAGVLRLFDVAHRWNQSAAESAPHLASSLVDRIDGLDKRIAGTDDAVAKEQYELAKSALVEQLRYLKDIGTSRERVLARMHNYMAAMERLRLAVINVESAQASRDPAEVRPLLSDFEELGRDIESCSEALAEADRAANGAAPAAVGAAEAAGAAEVVEEAGKAEAAVEPEAESEPEKDA
jgi:hypothetical protein